jgi:hypothetical protein
VPIQETLERRTRETEANYIQAWSGGLSIEDFIKVSKEGRANGDFIMHRELGTLVDLNPENGRAIGKMKTTITQRFHLDGIEFDIDCDNRFIFFCRKDTTASSPETPVWKVQYYKVFYEKDKVVPVDGKSVPDFTTEELGKYPEGYKHLGAAQAKLGHKILTDLPTMNNEGFTKLCKAMDLWLQGEEAAGTLGVPETIKPRF